MRCPGCGSFEDKVIDSRQSEDGSTIRRRRSCLVCQHRFTTFERLEEVPLLVVKRSGERVPFDRSKVIAGLVAAAKARPVEDAQLQDLATAVEEELRLRGGDVPSSEIGRVVLDRLRELDVVAAVRFASVYKEFDDLADFERELSELTRTVLTKATEPKRQ
ncbi:MAG: transcriptional repressor NrdR [Acidimicrobiales bacterium]|nr:transcriptional repressor NrdR [Acidimicrobiales bacterium]